MNYKHKNRSGFTLAEAMAALVVLSIVACGLLLPFTSGAAVQAEGSRSTLAAKLASDLMEKIIYTTPLDEIITRWGNYQEPQGLVKNDYEMVFSDKSYGAFSRSTHCEYVTMAHESGTGDEKFILATVSVQYNGREMASLNRLITQ